MSGYGLGSSFSSNTSTGQGKQAGVGLLLAEVDNSPLIVVKQVVPRGAAHRSGRVRVGDQILRVSGVDATTGMGVTDLRNLIVGEQGTRVAICFRHADTGEILDLDLVRGSPEFLDGGAVPSHPIIYQQGQMHHVHVNTSMPQYHGRGSVGASMNQGAYAQRSLYGSHGSVGQPVNQGKYTLGTSWSAEMFKQLPPPAAMARTMDPTSSLMEENEWLRSALRMAESTIMRHKQDLSGVRDMFVKHKVECEGKNKQMEGTNRVKDDERREAEQALLSAEEYRRSLEVRLREAQRRNEWIRETEEQIRANEFERIGYTAEVKRRADGEKRELEGELMSLNEDLRLEKGARQEAEQREISLRSDFNRLSEHRQMETSNTRQSYGDTRSSYDMNIGDSFATAQLGHYTAGVGQDKARIVQIPAARQSHGVFSREQMAGMSGLSRELLAGVPQDSELMLA